ncbi:MAG: hypothetical protein JNL80_17935 [Phycisphaerae bacterium]|nr:hypothetical protein [Phycisphaerae bacterium]
MRTTPLILAAASASLIALAAQGQSLSGSVRTVIANTSSTTTNAEGTWQWGVGVGPTSAQQLTTLAPTLIEGHAEGHAVWPAGNHADAELKTTVTLPYGGACEIQGTILTLIQSATSVGPGSGFLRIRDGENNVVFFVGASPPFNEPHGFGAGLSLPPGQYTIELHASAIAGGSSVVNGVNAHSVIDFAIAFVDLCGTNAGSCFQAHAGGYCDDAGCCSSVCAVDPACCAVAWDTECANLALAQCVAPLFTSEVIDPWTGHTHALTTLATWEVARLHALTNQAQLVTIHDGLENRWLVDRIASLVVEPTWIGLNDATREGAWRWSDGDPLSYAAWQPGQPNGGAAENYVEIGEMGRWNDLSGNVKGMGLIERSHVACGTGGSCFVPHGPGCSDESCCNVVCQIEPFCCEGAWDAYCVGLANQSCAPDVLAGPFIHPVTKHRYFLLESAVWPEAEKRAMMLGGHLVTIDSAAENEWIRLNLGNAAIGPTTFFIGAEDQLFEGFFEWQTGLSFPFANWNSGEPNDAGDGEDFVVVNASGGWNDVPLWVSAHSVVEASCLGDLDGDGLVSGADLGVLLGSWGSFGAAADLHVDGIVDAADLSVLLGAWGPCPGSSACSPHATPGSDLPACTACVCNLDSYCCESQWDSICVQEAGAQCSAPCQCY